MLGFVAIVAAFASAALVAVADAFIKKTATGSVLSAALNPWMILICVLYFVQIVLAVYIFVHKGDLAIYGNVFVVFYAVLMMLLGVFVFQEHLSPIQIIGIVLALTGAVLINSGF